ncbi:MAG: ABC transporter substrate-binding protein [Spirochaetaceae bacterium]|jgi:peptide/nickel transport system substrate-binding protein|nr:ABC transporter substrate-binding protein [Spirochaetaceae bacterium]
MMNKLKKSFFVVVALALTVGLTGCGKPATQAGEGIAGKYDSILRTTQDWPTYTDPAVGNDQSDAITMANLYDPFLYPDLNGEPAPHIAAEWSVSDNGLEYTFTIRDGIKFHSGNPLTADDVAYSMKRMLTIGEGFAYLYKGVVKDVQALDSKTVKFVLENSFGPFLGSLIRFMIVDSKVVAEHYDKSTSTYGEFGDYGKTWLLTNDAGSGPYRAIDIKLEEYVLGEKFDDYFLGWDPAAPEYFQISGAVEPVSVKTAMANRELEITDQIQPMENFIAMDAIEGIDVVAYDSAQTFGVSMNTKKAPTDDVHFRKALAYAFDYETVMTDIYPGAIPVKGPVPSNVPGNNPDIPRYTYDLEKARAELALSKYAGDPAAQRIELVWCAEVPEEEKIALLINANLSQLGIAVDIVKQPFGSMIESAQSIESTPNLSIVLTAPSYFEAGAVLKSRYHSSSSGTWEQMEWILDPVLDAAIDDALSTPDRDLRFEKYRQIQEQIYDLCPTIWMFSLAERRAYQSGYVEWPVAELIKQGAAFVFPMGYNVIARNTRVYPDRRR